MCLTSLQHSAWGMGTGHSFRRCPFLRRERCSSLQCRILGRQATVLRHRISLQKEPMPCRPMPLLVQLRAHHPVPSNKHARITKYMTYLRTYDPAEKSRNIMKEMGALCVGASCQRKGNLPGGSAVSAWWKRCFHLLSTCFPHGGKIPPPW